MEKKINLLYNFLYNTTFDNCFVIDKIKLGRIILDDIKLTDEKEINEHIEELNKAKFSYMDYTDSLIYIKRYSDSYNVTIKIGSYSNDINDMSNPCNNDALFSYLLSQLVLNKKTTHILLPIVNFDVPFNKIKNLIKNIPIYKSLEEKIEFNEIKNIFSIRVREHYSKSKLLHEYLSNNACLYKPLLFQIIHTLAVIQKEFPGFRHNNLNTENILIYLKKENDLEYEFDGNKWIIPNFGFDIKITNFENSVLPNYYGISTQRDTNIPYITEKNEYFDLHFFLNLFIDKKYKMEKTTKPSCEIDTNKFLDKVIPKQFRGAKDGSFYLNKNVVVVRPE